MDKVQIGLIDKVGVSLDAQTSTELEVTLLHSAGCEVQEDCSVRIDFGFGAKGDKPVKGVDYMTPEDVEAIKQEVKTSIDEDYADEIEQISVPITLDMRELRIDYRCKKKPRAKILIATPDGYTEAQAAVEYIGVNTVRVSWSKAIEGELIIN